MTRLAVGGTFDVLHRGHRALLDTAFTAGDEGVTIGVTADAFANAGRSRQVRRWSERVRALSAFLAARGYLARATIVPIDDPFGFAFDSIYDAIAVTAETAHTAARINEERSRRGSQRLRVLLAPYVLADDGRPISATRIRAGEIDVEGTVLRAMRPSGQR